MHESNAVRNPLDALSGCFLKDLGGGNHHSKEMLAHNRKVRPARGTMADVHKEKPDSQCDSITVHEQNDSLRKPRQEPAAVEVIRSFYHTKTAHMSSVSLA